MRVQTLYAFLWFSDQASSQHLQHSRLPNLSIFYFFSSFLPVLCPSYPVAVITYFSFLSFLFLSLNFRLSLTEFLVTRSFSLDLSLVLVSSLLLFKDFFRWILHDPYSMWNRILLSSKGLMMEYECWQESVFQKDDLSVERGTLQCCG